MLASYCCQLLQSNGSSIDISASDSVASELQRYKTELSFVSAHAYLG